MKKLALMLLVPLAACVTAPPAVPASPAALADRTVLDERAAISVELLYKGARTAVELAVDTGVLKGSSASQAAALDRRAYGAVLATRAAYRAGNADGYVTAAQEARSIIGEMLAIIG